MEKFSVLRQLLTSILKEINFSYLTSPLNLIEVREKFLSDPNFNPVLKYPPMPKEKLEKYLEDLNNLDLATGEKPLTHTDYYYQRKIEEAKLKLQLVLSRENSHFGSTSLKLFQCNFDKRTLDFAKKDAKINGKFEPQENLNAEQTVDVIREYLAKEYDIHDWEVLVTKSTEFYQRVSLSRKQIFVSENVNWDFCDMDNTLAHEIDGHTIRGINAKKQTDRLMRKPQPFYIKTDEGLACFLGDYISKTAEISRKHHAIKYLAGDLARKAGFLEVYKFFMDYGFTPELAFQRAYRLKRGLEDTSLPGCYGKEAAYYEGMIEVKDYVDNGGNIEKLFAGKFGLDDLKYVEVPEGVIVPKRIWRYVKKDG